MQKSMQKADKSSALAVFEDIIAILTLVIYTFVIELLVSLFTSVTQQQIILFSWFSDSFQFTTCRIQ